MGEASPGDVNNAFWARRLRERQKIRFTNNRLLCCDVAFVIKEIRALSEEGAIFWRDRHYHYFRKKHGERRLFLRENSLRQVQLVMGCLLANCATAKGQRTIHNSFWLPHFNFKSRQSLLAGVAICIIVSYALLLFQANRFPSYCSSTDFFRKSAIC